MDADIASASTTTSTSPSTPTSPSTSTAARAPTGAPPPPSLPGLPLVGQALRFLRDPVGLFQQGLRDRGRIFSFRLAGKKAVALLGPEYSRFFFEQTDKLLSIREGYPFFTRMFHESTYFFAEPSEYKAQRALVLPCFQGKKMASYVGVMARETEAFMDGLGDSGTFDLTPTLGPLVMNVAAAAFLGDDFRQQLGDEFFEVFRDFSGGMEVVLPLWLPLPHLRRSQRAKQRLHRMLGELIERRRQNPREPADFLQNLVDARYPNGSPVPDLVLINLMIILIWAGHETTAGHVSWGLTDLLQNPTELERVRREQDQVLDPAPPGGGPRPLTLEQLNRLDHLERALKETERMNPVAYILMRQAAQDFELGGYRVEAGTLVFCVPTVSHRLPEVFAAPERYDPDRFAPPRAEDKQPFSLIGFGGSVHRCAGVNFAYQEMKAILTLLLERYDFQLLDGVPVPAAGPKTKWPASPCRVRYQRRPARPPLSDERPRSSAENVPRPAGCPVSAAARARA